jgi:SAM-dependent methyltransferase
MNKLFKQFNIENIHKNVSKLSLLHKIFILLIIYLFYSIISTKYLENYTGKATFNHKIDNECYDDFYCSYYDSIFLDKNKDYNEIEYIKNLKLKSDSRILDVGCGTGNHVNLLTDKYVDTIGIDQSPSMINIAKKNYPHCSFANKNIFNLDNTSLDNNSPDNNSPDNKNNNIDLNTKFNAVTCLGKTIYIIPDKEEFFKTVNNLLDIDGLLIIHLINRDNFEPYRTSNNSSVLFNPKKYISNIQINKKLIKYPNLEYNSKYQKHEQYDEQNNNDKYSMLPYSIYKEEFYDYNTKNVRRNDINLYISDMNTLIDLIKSNGFIYHSKKSLDKYNYKNEYIYTFKKL